NDMPKVEEAWKLNAEESVRWANLMALRDDVNKALELARAEKIVGKPLDAKVTLYVADEAKAAWETVKDADLAALCIVSELEVSDSPVEGWAGTEMPGVTVKVEASELAK